MSLIIERAIFGLLVLVLISLSSCSQGEAGDSPPVGAAAPPQGPPPVPAMVTTAIQRSIQVEISTVGSLRSPETTTVSADISGIIVSLDAPEGREIRRGHLIARLDEKEAQAALRVAEARARNARIALDRARPLVSNGVASQQTLDDAVAEMATGEGLLEEARTRLLKTEVRAPFSGLVGIQTAQLGQYVSSGDPIIQLTRIDPLELVFGVPEEQAVSVRIGQRVQARVGRCGIAFEAVVEALDPQLDFDTRTLRVQARVGNVDRLLIPGMSARLRLAIGEAESGVVVPREALVAEATRYLVWVVDDEGKVSRRSVVPGSFLPDVVEIKSGLEAGEKVVAAGHQKLRPGGMVREMPWQETVNANLRQGSRGADDCGEEG